MFPTSSHSDIFVFVDFSFILAPSCYRASAAPAYSSRTERPANIHRLRTPTSSFNLIPISTSFSGRLLFCALYFRVITRLATALFLFGCARTAHPPTTLFFPVRVITTLFLTQLLLFYNCRPCVLFPIPLSISCFAVGIRHPGFLHPLTGQQTQTLNMPKADKPVRKTKATRGETGGRRKKGELSSQLLLTSANKRLTDPNAPKRGLSAYMFFANDNRDKVREENPGISFGKIMRLTHDGITRR